VTNRYRTRPLASPGLDPEYLRVRHDIEVHPNTFVLLPCLDRDACVAETVRRQTARPFGRPAAKEEAVIRSRFKIYMALSEERLKRCDLCERWSMKSRRRYVANRSDSASSHTRVGWIASNAAAATNRTGRNRSPYGD